MSNLCTSYDFDWLTDLTCCDSPDAAARQGNTRDERMREVQKQMRVHKAIAMVQEIGFKYSRLATEPMARRGRLAQPRNITIHPSKA